MCDLYIHSLHSYYRGLEDLPFTKALNNLIMRGAPISLKISALFCRPGMALEIGHPKELPDFSGADRILELQRARWAHTVCD